jgi:hypothetical protein
MNRTARRWKLVVFSTIVLVVQGLTGSSIVADDSVKPGFCAAPEFHQFDFWIGDWEVFEVGGTTPVARVLVDRVVDGCALREQYSGSDGHKGQSISIYDVSRKVWHQTWVTNRGELLTIEGRFKNGEVVMSGTWLRDDVPTLVRGTWKPVNGDVSEKAVTSTDGGKTWKTWFDLVFRPARSGSTP